MHKQIRTIQIKTTDGSRAVEAWVYGPFAVHLASFEPIWRGYPGSCYTISHRATGYRLVDVMDLRRAQQLALALKSAIGRNDVTEQDYRDKTPRYLDFSTICRDVIHAALVKGKRV